MEDNINPLGALTAAEAKKIADESNVIFGDICDRIMAQASKGMCRLDYSFSKNDMSRVAYDRLIERLKNLGYKVEKDYSSIDIIIEWW